MVSGNGITWLKILVLIFGTFFAWYSWWVLPDAARQRGEQVKAAFDIYRSELAKALGFELPLIEADERRMWRLVSRRMLLRVSEDRLTGYEKSLDAFRRKESESSSNKNTKGRNVDVSTKESENEDTVNTDSKTWRPQII